jgi:hypothetical protein
METGEGEQNLAAIGAIFLFSWKKSVVRLVLSDFAFPAGFFPCTVWSARPAAANDGPR